MPGRDEHASEHWASEPQRRLGRRRTRSQRCRPRIGSRIRPPLALDPGPVRQRHPRLFRPVRGASAAHCRSFDHGGRRADPRRQGNRPRPHHRRRRTRACRRLRQCQAPHRDGPRARARQGDARCYGEGLCRALRAPRQSKGQDHAAGDRARRTAADRDATSRARDAVGGERYCREWRGGLAESHTPAATRADLAQWLRLRAQGLVRPPSSSPT